jgi:hypothetical protein
MKFGPSMLLLVTLGLCGEPAWAGQIVVLDSEPATSSLHVGVILDGNRQITVAPGARAVLMDEAGRVVTVIGPYRGTPGGENRKQGPGLLKRLAAALITTRQATQLAGGTRGTGDLPAVMPTDPWLVDVTAGGTECVRAGSAVMLWRPVPRRDTQIEITRLGGRAHARANWPAGEATISWPREMFARNGTAFVLRLQDSRTDRRIKLRIISPATNSDADKLAALLEAGCASQGQMLLAMLFSQTVIDGASAKNSPLFKH